ncbi:hypothetical protein LTR84_006780 [Exophiala bonariae]|uniref:Uncharacterized protein n=1 Tax=Exophiala bonariae TaxID=1690606 RepID=A0AAV9MZW7_9EURO|nr:hypothetical protein LTR84_006780 [Exophiala bonariae]
MNTPTDPSAPERSSTAPTAFTSPASRRQQRKKRQQPSDESTSPRIDSTIDLRQGFPAPLLRWPLLTHPVGPDADERINWQSARLVMLDIMEKHGFRQFSMSVVNRLPDPSAGRLPAPEHNQNLTCLIITRRNLNTNSWYLALKDIEEQFEMGNLAGFTVEIVDPEMFKPQFPGPIGPHEPIVPLWPDLRPQILSQLWELDWFSLSVVHFGRRLDPLKNPVTLVIGTPEITCHTWDPLINAIQGILNQSGLDDVEVAIIPAKHPLSAFEDPSTSDDPPALDIITDRILPTSAFQSDIEPGSSFGPDGLITTATLGGVVRLRDGNGNTEDMVMSVFHPFRSIVGQEREANGLRRDTSSNINIVVPSKQDRDEKLKWIETLIQDTTQDMVQYQEKLEWTGEERWQKALDIRVPEVERYQAEKKIVEAFDPYAGVLRAYSGFQTQSLHDWSLSAVSNRALKLNTLPARSENLPFSMDASYHPLSSEIKYRSAQSPQSGEKVWKKGRTTGITSGKISHLRTDIALPNSLGQKIIFTGWEITPDPDQTGQRGSFVRGRDSGAWVVDMDGSWRGMVFAELTSGSGVMEDVEVIVQDVERMTGCTLELP